MNRLLRFAALGALAATAPAADFSYYVLSLSYAPTFCATSASGARDARECGPNRPAFVVHGLWPESNNGRGVEKCGPARPVAADLVRTMLNYFPTEGLIQHEWATHGTCSGMSAKEYFAKVREARDGVRVPPQWENLRTPLVASPQEFKSQFSSANPGISWDAVRLACNASGLVSEIRVCLDQSLKPHSCTGMSDCTRLRVQMPPAGGGR